MQKYCFFKTFDEAKISQQYDHNYQKALAFSEITGIDITTIRNNNLHIVQNDLYPIDDYIVTNNIPISNKIDFENVKEYFKVTTSWAQIYRLENEYCYIINGPDVPYEDIREIDSSSLILLDSNGDDISGEGN